MPATVLYRPIRATGICTASFFAANDHHRRQELLEELRWFQARHGTCRFTVRTAVLVTSPFVCLLAAVPALRALEA